VVAGEGVVTRGRARPLTVAAWAGVIVYCWFAGRFASFTWQSTMAVLVPGLTIFTLAIGRSPRRRPAPQAVGTQGVVAWAVPLLSFCVMEIGNDLLGSTYAHPTLSILLDPVLDVHVWRSAGYFVWIWVGWALVKR
jgi:hypothetical protein